MPQKCGASPPALYSPVVIAYRARRAFSISLEIAEVVVLTDLITQV